MNERHIFHATPSRFFFILAVCFLSSACAEKPEAGHGLVRETSGLRVMVGEKVVVAYRLTLPEGAVVAKSDGFAPDLGKGLELIGKTPWQPSPERNALRYRTEYRAVKGGVYNFPPVEVQVGGIRFTAPSFQVVVQSHLGETPDPKSVRLNPWYGPLTPAAPLRMGPIVAGTVFFLLGCTALAVLYVKKRRSNSDPLDFPPDGPDAVGHGKALRRLAALAASDLVQAERAESFFDELASIYRDYLTEVFGIDARNRTTGEIVAILELDARMARSEKILIRDLLYRSDAVRFARAGIDPDRRREAVATLADFVREHAGSSAVPPLPLD